MARSGSHLRGRRLRRPGGCVSLVVVADRLCDVREALQPPGRAGAAGTRLIRRSLTAFTVSKDGRIYIFDAQTDVPLPHGRPVTAQSFADAFNRIAKPKLGSPATAYMREIEASSRGDRRQGGVDLRCPRARPLPAADPAHQAARRLHRPADVALLLPDPPRTRRSTRAGSTTLPAPARTTSPSESSTSASFMKRNPYYGGNRPRTSTRSSGRPA